MNLATRMPESPRASLMHPPGPAETGDAGIDARGLRDPLSLVCSLHRSLNPRRVLQVFGLAVAHRLSHQGLFFHHPECQLASGRPSAHRCEYNLTLEGVELGQLTLHRDRPFDDGELAQIDALLSLLGYPLRNALQHARVERSAREDALTGLLNRAALARALPREIALAQRDQRRLSLLLLDIDHFKRLNDRLGHAAGDAALRRLSGVIARSTRRSDQAFRYGGEEFVLLLPNTSASGARRVAERVREYLVLEPPVDSAVLTVSTGIAQLSAGDDAEGLLARADAALYGAKQAGRDRIQFADAGRAPRRPA